jgi:CheY-like chemotaxis protein
MGRASTRRILVVDDNQDAALSLAMMLNIMGNETQIAHDGVEALDVAAAFQPDVVLLDIGLPRLNGYDVCRRLRAQPYGKNMLVVAVTGWGQEEDRRQSHEAGFDKHLVKPVDPEQLIAFLAEMQAGKA